MSLGGWHLWIWPVAALLLGGAAIGLVYCGIRGDPAKGRKRCPKCWYDMSGGTGLTCPECGRTVKTEAKLLRARRSERRIVLGLVVALAAYGLWKVPDVQSKGWVTLVPTTVLLMAVDQPDYGAGSGGFGTGMVGSMFRPVLGSSLVGTNRPTTTLGGLWKDAQSAMEIELAWRHVLGKLWDWQRRTVALRSLTTLSRDISSDCVERWPCVPDQAVFVNKTFPTELAPPAPTIVRYFGIRALQRGSTEGVIASNAELARVAMDPDVMPPLIEEIGRGAGPIPVEFTLYELGSSGARIELWRQKSTLQFPAARLPDESVAVKSNPEIDSIVAGETILHLSDYYKSHSGPAGVYVGLPQHPMLKGMAVALRVEFVMNAGTGTDGRGEVIADAVVCPSDIEGRIRWRDAATEARFMSDGRWKNPMDPGVMVRVRGERAAAMPGDAPAKSYWAGEFTKPLSALMEPERK